MSTGVVRSRWNVIGGRVRSQCSLRHAHRRVADPPLPTETSPLTLQAPAAARGRLGIPSKEQTCAALVP